MVLIFIFMWRFISINIFVISHFAISTHFQTLQDNTSFNIRSDYDIDL